MLRASETGGALGERSNLNEQPEENISVLSKNITQMDLDMKLASTVEVITNPDIHSLRL